MIQATSMVLIFRSQEGVVSNNMNISIATKHDIGGIQSFINSEWKENHILARDVLFFKYEYVYANKLNFIVAKLDDKIQGVIGFVPSKISTTNNQICHQYKFDHS